MRSKPCVKFGNHEVVNIECLTVDGDDNHIYKKGYRFRGTCKFCQGSIIAKTIEELNHE